MVLETFLTLQHRVFPTPLYSKKGEKEVTFISSSFLPLFFCFLFFLCAVLWELSRFAAWWSAGVKEFRGRS